MRSYHKDPRGEAAELLQDLRSVWYRFEPRAYHIVWIIAAAALIVAAMGGV